MEDRRFVEEWWWELCHHGIRVYAVDARLIFSGMEV